MVTRGACGRRKQAATHRLLLPQFALRNSDAQAALAAIAKEKKFLDVKVKIRCPNGEVVNSTARLRVDTGANTDVVSLD